MLEYPGRAGSEVKYMFESSGPDQRRVDEFHESRVDVVEDRKSFRIALVNDDFARVFVRRRGALELGVLVPPRYTKRLAYKD